MSRIPMRAVPLALLACVGCSDIPPPSYINVTEIAAVRQEVIELGALHPDRVGPLLVDQHEIPIAEVLPGDRLLLETIVVDPEGRRLDEDEIETLWLQCGTGPCTRVADGFASPTFDQPCSETPSWSTDSFCLLGQGSARLELGVPLPGPQIFGDPRMSFYAVVAWNGRAVEDCWTARRGDRALPGDCGFIYHNVVVGPTWWFMAWGDSIGLAWAIPYRPDEFPPWVYLQVANRIPRPPTLTVRADGVELAAGEPPLATIAIAAGVELEVELRWDPVSQLPQSKFVPIDDSDEAFGIEPEIVLSRTLTSGAIRRIGEELPVVGDGRFVYEVRRDEPPGISRVLIGYRDDRGANDLLTLEFDVQ